MAEKKAKEVNIVDQNAIWRETIRKETRCQKLYTEYHINPYKARGRKFLVIFGFLPIWVNFEEFLGLLYLVFEIQWVLQIRKLEIIFPYSTRNFN